MKKEFKKVADEIRGLISELVKKCHSIDQEEGGRKYTAKNDDTLVWQFNEDLFTYMIYLIGADEIVADEEIELLHNMFPDNTMDSSGVKEYLRQFKSNDLDDKSSWDSFYSSVQYDNDTYEKKKEESKSLSETMFEVYCEIGFLVISCDEDLDEKEIKKLTSITGAIESFLCDGLKNKETQNAICEKYRDLKKHLEKSIATASRHLENTNSSSPSPESGSSKEKEPPKTYSKCKEELKNLVGLSMVKEDVQSLINYSRVSELRTERGLTRFPLSKHLVFTGNPGTGKTTVARLLGEIYREIDVLSKGHLVEANRSKLVKGYEGQTALNVVDIVKSAKGGVLFIDEAYSLLNDSIGCNDPFGKEAITTLMEEMEKDENRDDLVVIVAGYPDLMQNFLNSNPGLRSRFNKVVEFPDYTPNELYGVFEYFCQKYQLKMTEEAQKLAERSLTRMYNKKGRNFGNARDVRNFFEKAFRKLCDRVAKNLSSDSPNEQLTTFIDKDFQNVHI